MATPTDSRTGDSGVPLGVDAESLDDGAYRSNNLTSDSGVPDRVDAESSDDSTLSSGIQSYVTTPRNIYTGKHESEPLSGSDSPREFPAADGSLSGEPETQISLHGVIPLVTDASGPSGSEHGPGSETGKANSAVNKASAETARGVAAVQPSRATVVPSFTLVQTSPDICCACAKKR